MPRTPKAGTLESLVRWHVARGSSVLDIIGASQNSKFNRSRQFLPTFIERWTTHFGVAPNVLETTRISSRNQAKLIQFGKAPGFQRFTADITWINPNSGVKEERTYAIDIPSGLRGAAKQEAIANALGQVLSKQYNGTFVTDQDLARFLLSYNLRAYR